VLVLAAAEFDAAQGGVDVADPVRHGGRVVAHRHVPGRAYSSSLRRAPVSTVPSS